MKNTCTYTTETCILGILSGDDHFDIINTDDTFNTKHGGSFLA